MATAGKVYLVGAGPGAPDLLTLRAAHLLERADIVFHDALMHPDTLAFAVRAEKVAFGKRCGKQSTAQRFINKRLVDAAFRCGVVVRLKGGDPLLFGRAQEEIDALEQAGVACEVVPGITAALAASADVRTSMTRRGLSRNVAFVTPRAGRGENEHDWARSILAADTGAIYMGAGEAEQIAATLMARGVRPDLPVVVVENASLPQSRRIALPLSQLGAIAASGITGPALILLGEVYARAQGAVTVTRDDFGTRVA